MEAALIRCGYERTEQVEGPGQFARRGGILDLFSPAEEQPVRMEFWGDEIDSMGYFDVSSQRRDEQVTEVRILPAAEALAALAPGGPDAAAEKLESLAARYEKRRSSASAAKQAANMRAAAEKIREGFALTDLDCWLPVLYEPATGFDYIPEDAFVFLDQPTRCGELARDWQKQLTDELRLLQKDGLCPFEAGTSASRRKSCGSSWTAGRSTPATRSPWAAAASGRRRCSASRQSSCLPTPATPRPRPTT